jgi:hypothetical protein
MRPASLRGVLADGNTRPGVRYWLFSGTFLISFALLAFEISTVRTISFAVGPSFIYLAIAIAMLGLTSAGSILSMVDLNAVKLERGRVLFWACIAIALLLVAAHFLAAADKADLNQAISAAGRRGGLKAILPVLMFDGSAAALKIGMFLCLPYFLFGGLLSYLFATSRSTEHGPLYAADLIGAAAGCAGAIVVMETTDYAVSVTVPAVIAALAAGAYAMAESRRHALAGLTTAALLSAGPLFAGYSHAIEPQADPHYLVRDYEYRSNVSEVWHRWNSFTRVGAIEHHDHNPPFATLSLANGDGMAFLFPFEPHRSTPLLHWPAVPALLLGPAKDALVLFAGAGADLMTEKANGFGHVVGVELNQTIIDAARALPAYRFADFVNDPTVSLKVAEGRAFLERDRSAYDVILMSWSGATAVYYLGALGGTTQYLFTYEGLSEILDHLKPSGFGVILQANKVKMLAALRRYLTERHIGNPERTAIILFRDNSLRDWRNHFDDNPMLIKPSGWTDTEVARVVANAKVHGYHVAYAPGLPVHPDYTVYRRVLLSPDSDAEIAALDTETGLRFDVVTDDRPFYLDLFDNGRYLSGDFWLGLARGTLKPAEIYHLFRCAVVILVGLAAFTLSLAPLLLGKRPTSRSRAGTYLGYFLCLGAGFMFLEIGIMQKGSLLFGNPGLTIALVLGGIILFAGIGSLISNWSFRHGLTVRTAAALVVVYLAALVVMLNPVLEAVIGWSFFARILILCLIIAPGGIVMGHLFPQGLALARREDPTLVPWAWAANGAMSAFVAGLAPLVAQAFGFQVLLIIAGVLYAAVMLLPVAVPAERRSLARA